MKASAILLLFLLILPILPVMNGKLLKRLAAIFLAVIFVGGIFVQSAPEAFASGRPAAVMADCDQNMPMPMPMPSQDKGKMSGCLDCLGCMVFPAVVPAAVLSHNVLPPLPLRFYGSMLIPGGLSLRPDHNPPIS
jgi:hypothetical protein